MLLTSHFLSNYLLSPIRLIGKSQSCFATPGIVFCWLFLLIASVSSEEIQLKEGLVITHIGEYGRNPLHKDAIEAQIVNGQWIAPREGTAVSLIDGSTQSWRSIQSDGEGWFSEKDIAGGYVYFRVQSEKEKILLLDSSGHNLVYVNGMPRTGDRYGLGITLLPIQLRVGSNDLLFLSGRGRLKASLTTPPSTAQISLRDNTLPDLLVGESSETWGAAVVINASTEPLTNAFLWIAGEGLHTTMTPIPTLLPLSIRKVGFRLQGPAPRNEGSLQFTIDLVKQKDDTFHSLDKKTIEIAVRQPDQSHKRTFISAIDGSVQYYGVQPAHPLPGDSTPPALFLSLHGAGVEASGQASSYSPKSWGMVIAPTNRRPYGFDWEDWGRKDALEVLELAQEKFHTDPHRTYLTGHSMGGHGTWQLGVLFPNRFAAIAPSAGWCSFWSYADSKPVENPTPVEAMLKRAVATSDTLSLSRNYQHEGVYILHGDADDNVPISEARAMRDHLQTFHRDLDGHEQPGAGHWWDQSDEPGTDCVDWLPIFNFFARHRLPSDGERLSLEFTTANPSVSSRFHWVRILAQIHALQPSSVSIRFDPGKQRFVATTSNIARLAIDLTSLPVHHPLRVEIDGQIAEGNPITPELATLYLERHDTTWILSLPPNPSQKCPLRYGPFKEAFDHRMMFVYGTAGNALENDWALAKARYDAEEFWYRGNGSIDVIPDTQFNVETTLDRNIILYGNADTNGAWNSLLKNSPIQVKRGSIRIGDRQIDDDRLACLFISYRERTTEYSVGAISGSGIMGMRLCDRIPYFVSGIGYPDCIVMGPEVLEQGSSGIRTAGFFGLDWTVEQGEFAWNP